MRELFAIVLMALSLTGCAQRAPAPEVRSVASGMLELPLGQPLSGPLGDPDNGPIGGTAYYQLPMTGALVTTFYDFTAETEVSSRKLVSVSARRKFSSFAECKSHMRRLTQALAAKYAFEISAQDAYLFDKTSGPIRAVVHCSTGSDFVNSSLSVRVSDRALSEASAKRINEHFDGSAGSATSASAQP
jgi:hypothetical protein